MAGKFLRMFRGPRLGTKLMLLGLTLLIVPWFSYRQLIEMERLLIQGQSHAQLLTAEGISTLFNGREDLFNDLPVTIEDFESLYAHPLQNPVRMDGRLDDWGDNLSNELLSFGSESGQQDGDFALLLGERGGRLNVFMRIQDGDEVYREPGYLRLDTADHVRLISFIRTQMVRTAACNVTLPGPGVITAYEMDADWRCRGNRRPGKRRAGIDHRKRRRLLGGIPHAAVDHGFAAQFRRELRGRRRHRRSHDSLASRRRCRRAARRASTSLCSALPRR